MAADLDPRWHGVFIQADQFHFHRQLWERWGVVLAPGDFTAMRQAIDGGQAVKLHKSKRGGTVYAVVVPSVGKTVLVLTSGWRFLTAYPRDKRLMARLRAMQ